MNRSISRTIFLLLLIVCYVATTLVLSVEMPVKEDIDYTPIVNENEKDAGAQQEPVSELEPMGSLSKTYMDYRAITDKTSKQWALLQTLTIGDDGMIRDNDGYIAAALGSAFGPIGSRYVFKLEGGKELLIIKADQKQDKHTCENNIFGLDNWDIIEFVVDSSKMPIYTNGYVYGGNFNNCPEYAGDVLSWTKVD